MLRTPAAVLPAAFLAGIAYSLLAVLTGGEVSSQFGNPSSPQAFEENHQYAAWDVQVHQRDNGAWNNFPGLTADHGDNCSAPPTTHHVGSYEDAVYVCNDHLMTATDSAGYAMIALTPNQLLDLSSGSGSVTWDMSTERQSGRDWPAIKLSCWDDNVALSEVGVPDLQGAPRNSIFITAFNSNGFVVREFIDDEQVIDQHTAQTPALQHGIVSGTNQAATRQPFKITITPGHFKAERLASSTGSNVVFYDGPMTDLPCDDVVVQFEQHSYSPTKDGAGIPATWHWDNFAISPSIPFTIIHANGANRFTGTSGTVNFLAPAPENSWLRFAAIGSVEVFTDVAGWLTFPNLETEDDLTDVTTTIPKQKFEGAEEHVSSYFVPIPAGTQQVMFRLSTDNWYHSGFGFLVEGIAIWSRTSSPTPVTPTPASSQTPSATATQTPTSLPTSSSTSTPTTAAPSPTATATPVKCRIQTGNGNTWTIGQLRPFAGGGFVCVVP